MKHSIGFLFACLYCTSFLSGQEYSHITYTTSDGLPDNIIVSVYEDRSGYLWIATGNGISRFDGSHFTNYSVREGLPSVYALGFYQDHNGRLWVSTRHGIAEFQNDSLHQYPITGTGTLHFVQKFIEDDAQRLIAITNIGLLWFDQDQWKPYPDIPGLEGDTIVGWVKTSAADYFNVNGNAVCRLDTHGVAQTIWRRYAATPTLRTLHAFSDTAYFTTFDSVYRIDENKITTVFADLISEQTIRSLWKDNASSFWITSDEEGISHYILSPEGVRKENVPIPYNFIAHITGDSRSLKWASTGVGLLKFVPRPFRSVRIAEARPGDHIRHLIALPHNEFLVSLGYGRLLHLRVDPSVQAGYVALHEITFSQNDDFVDSYAIDTDSALWLATRYGKLYRYLNGSMTNQTSLIDPAVHKRVYDVDLHPLTKQLLVSTEDLLLTLNGTSPDTFRDANHHVIKKPAQVIINDTGFIFIQTYSDGAFVLSPLPGAVFERLPPGTSVYNRYVDFQNNPLMIDGGRSLVRFTGSADGSVTREIILSEHAVIGSHFSDLIGDHTGAIWGVSPGGVMQLVKTESGAWSNSSFSAFDNQPNLYRDFTRLAESGDQVWLSLTHELISFQKSQIRTTADTPGIVIEAVLLNNQRTQWENYTDTLFSYFRIPWHPVMNHDENTLTFHYNAPDLLNHASLEYAYRLLPEDTAWSGASRNRSVSFNKLRAGEYEFQVKSVSASGTWSQPASFPFTIRKPYWDQTWFHLLIVAIAVLIIAFLFRFRVLQERKKGEMKNQLLDLEMRALRAQMNPHFIYNALNSIQSLVATNQTAQAGRYISMFARLLRQVLEYSQKGVVSLTRELETVRLYLELEKLRLDTPVTYTEVIDPEIIPDATFVPPLLLQPFVENALWHGLSRKAGGKVLEIRMEFVQNSIRITITDNGIGRAKAAELRSSAHEHTSMALSVTSQRIIDFNRDGDPTPLTITDLMENGQPAGTQVSFHLRFVANPELNSDKPA